MFTKIKLKNMFTRETFIQRRKSLLDLMIAKGAKGYIVLPGNNNVPYNYKANVYPHFKQDSTFRYFFGLNEPGVVGMISIETGGSYIIGEDPSIEDIVWEGKPMQTLKERAYDIAGIELIIPTIPTAVEINKIHSIPPYQFPSNITAEYISKDLIESIVSLRSIKSEEEIKHLDEIQNVAFLMHTKGAELAHAGKSASKIFSALNEIVLEHNGYFSFPPIISTEGQILHNPYYGRDFEKTGKLYLLDLGFDSEHGYTTDHTRVWPVKSKMNEYQRDIFKGVKKSKDQVEILASPKYTYLDMHLLAARTIIDELKDIGLMHGDTEDIIETGAYTTFFPHGLGHMMGMDVHDMENLGENYVGYDDKVTRSDKFGLKYLRMARKLEPGMVVTNEPGIYFIPELIEKRKAEKTFDDFINWNKVSKYMHVKGIRLEDDLLITQDGNRILGDKKIPLILD